MALPCFSLLPALNRDVMSGIQYPFCNQVGDKKKMEDIYKNHRNIAPSIIEALNQNKQPPISGLLVKLERYLYFFKLL